MLSTRAALLTVFLSFLGWASSDPIEPLSSDPVAVEKCHLPNYYRNVHPLMGVLFSDVDSDNGTTYWFSLCGLYVRDQRPFNLTTPDRQNVSAVLVVNGSSPIHAAYLNPRSKLLDKKRDVLNLLSTGSSTCSIYVLLRCESQPRFLHVFTDLSGPNCTSLFELHHTNLCEPSGHLHWTFIVLISFSTLMFVYLLFGLFYGKAFHGLSWRDSVRNTLYCHCRRRDGERVFRRAVYRGIEVSQPDSPPSSDVKNELPVNFGVNTSLLADDSNDVVLLSL